MRHAPVLLLLGLSTLANLACTAAAPQEASDSSENDYTVTPTGGSGQLQITLPAGTGPALVFARRKDGAGPPIDLTDGKVKSVSPATYCIWTRVTGSNPYDIQYETQSDCTVTVATGGSVVYALGAVAFTRSRNDLVFGLDVGADTSYTNQQTRRFLGSTKAIPHANGSFEYVYVTMKSGWSGSPDTPLDAFAISVAAGATSTIDLVDTTNRFGTRILPATPRALPNAPTQISAQVGTSTYATTASWFDIGSLPKPVLVRAKASALLYVTTPAPQQIALTQPIVDRPLARLDVEDVAVTMPDGSIKKARGTVTIGGFTMPTNAGIDLLPGTYSMNVSYVHPGDGATIVSSYTANVQP
ncbi:MAG: hypothetical protein QOI41_2382 [Myxococcales bacterium]|jgi:hypothetical protein|nr:hypothetical protein [Myxococcales bacterium]